MTGIVKEFPGVRALGGVDLDVRAGEVHCLLGQNGAGKSTLIKVLSGAYQPDEGTIAWDGEEIAFSTPASGDRARHLDDLPGARPGARSSTSPRTSSSATRSPVAGSPSASRRDRRVREPAGPARPLRDLADRRVGQLSPAAQQIVSMARALSHDTRLLILDEPSAVLDQEEVQNLFRVIRGLTAEGVAVVYISHRLEEIRQIGDRITVLKDGRTVATGLPSRTPRPPS